MPKKQYFPTREEIDSLKEEFREQHKRNLILNGSKSELTAVRTIREPKVYTVHTER